MRRSHPRLKSRVAWSYLYLNSNPATGHTPQKVCNRPAVNRLALSGDAQSQSQRNAMSSLPRFQPLPSSRPGELWPRDNALRCVEAVLCSALYQARLVWSRGKYNMLIWKTQARVFSTLLSLIFTSFGVCLIFTLFRFCCPSNIPRFIIPIIVNAIYGICAGWSATNML